MTNNQQSQEMLEVVAMPRGLSRLLVAVAALFFLLAVVPFSTSAYAVEPDGRFTVDDFSFEAVVDDGTLNIEVYVTEDNPGIGYFILRLEWQEDSNFFTIDYSKPPSEYVQAGDIWQPSNPQYTANKARENGSTFYVDDFRLIAASASSGGGKLVTFKYDISDAAPDRQYNVTAQTMYVRPPTGSTTFSNIVWQNINHSIPFELSRSNVPKVEFISLSQSSATLPVGGPPMQLSATVSPDGANDEVEWSSNNTDVATVSLRTGVVTAVAPGIATITATARDGSGVSDSCEVTVYQPVTSVGLYSRDVSGGTSTIASAPFLLEVGGASEIFTRILPESASNKTLTLASDNEDVAIVEEVNGHWMVVSKGPGFARIKATTTDGSDITSSSIYVGVAPAGSSTQPAARIGDVQYDTFDEALAAWREGETITLLRDALLAERLILSVNEGSFDLGGHMFVAPGLTFSKRQFDTFGNGRVVLGREGFGGSSFISEIRDCEIFQPGSILLTGGVGEIRGCLIEVETAGYALVRALDSGSDNIVNTATIEGIYDTTIRAGIDYPATGNMAVNMYAHIYSGTFWSSGTYCLSNRPGASSEVSGGRFFPRPPNWNLATGYSWSLEPDDEGYYYPIEGENRTGQVDFELITPGSKMELKNNGTVMQPDSVFDDGASWSYTLTYNDSYDFVVWASGDYAPRSGSFICNWTGSRALPISLDPKVGHTLKTGDIILFGGEYQVPVGTLGSVIIMTTEPVTLVGEGIGPDARHSNVEFVCQPGAQITIRDLWNTRAPTLYFEGANNRLSLEGENILEALTYSSAGFIVVQKGSDLGPDGELTIDGGPDGEGVLWGYKYSIGAGIGGTSNTAGGKLTFESGHVFIKGSKTGPLIGGDAGAGPASRGRINDDITISGGELVLINKAMGDAIGDGSNSQCAGDVYLTGGSLTIISDFRGDAIGSTKNSELGNLYVTGGSFRAVRTGNALNEDYTTGFQQVDFGGVVPRRFDAPDGEAVYPLAFNTALLSEDAGDSFEVLLDGVPYYSGGLHHYFYGPSVDYTPDNFDYIEADSPYYDSHLYFFATEGAHTLTVNGEDFDVYWQGAADTRYTGSFLVTYAGLDKAALTSAISDAEGLLGAVTRAASGDEVPSDQQWALPLAWDTYQGAVYAAKAVALDLLAAQAQIDAAVDALAKATATFNNALHDGTLPEPGDDSVAVTGVAISVEGGGEASITEAGGSLQLAATVEPVDATSPAVVWSVYGGRGFASIDAETGLLTARADGTVTVRATATDGSGVFGALAVEIGGQVPGEAGPYLSFGLTGGEGAGTLTVNGDAMSGSAPLPVLAGEELALEALPSTGYYLAQLRYSVDGGKSYTALVPSEGGGYSLAMPDTDVDVQADFVLIIWDGTIDLTWYDPDASVYTLSYPAQFAGAAAINNGIFTTYPTSRSMTLDGQEGDLPDFGKYLTGMGVELALDDDPFEVAVGALSHLYGEFTATYRLNDSQLSGYPRTGPITATTRVIGEPAFIVAYRATGTPNDNNLVTTTDYYFGAEDYADKTILIAADMDFGGVRAGGVWDTSSPLFMSLGGQYAMLPGLGSKTNSYAKLSSSFCGTLDGLGHSFTNVYAERYSNTAYGDSQSLGIVGRLGAHDDDPQEIWPYNPTVRRIVFDSGFISARRSVGGIVGKIGKTVGSSKGSPIWEGGPVDGAIGGIVEYCVNKAEVKGTDAKGVAGIVGTAWNGGVVRYCANLGAIATIYHQSPVGGIVGSNEIDVYNCYSVGPISAPLARFAMGVGTSNSGTGGAIEDCWWLAGTAAGGGYWDNVADDPDDYPNVYRFGGEGDAVQTLTADELNANSGGSPWIDDVDGGVNALGGVSYPVLYFQGGNGQDDAYTVTFEATLPDGGLHGTVVADRTNGRVGDSVRLSLADVGAGWALDYFTVNGERISGDSFPLFDDVTVSARMRSLVAEGFTLDLPDGGEVFTLVVTRTGIIVDEGGVASLTEVPVPIADGATVYEGDVLSFEAHLVPGAKPDVDKDYDGRFSFVTSFGAVKATTFSWMTPSVEITSARAAAAKAAAAGDSGGGAGGSDGSGGSGVGVISVTVTPQIADATWLGQAETSWYDPDAPETSYTLDTIVELAGLAALVNGNPSVDFAGVTITLDSDISLEGLPWVPVGTLTKPFKGVFDGGGHTVSDLSIPAGAGVANALFGAIEDAEVRSLVVSGSVSADTGAVAGIVARAAGSLIEDCTSQVTVTGGGSYTGGVVGFADDDTVITGCLNEGAVVGVGSGSVGGTAGELFGSGVYSSLNTGAVSSGAGAAGGIAGRVTSSVISAVYSTGDVSTDTGQAGGIAGTIGSGGGGGGGSSSGGSSVVCSYTVSEVAVTGGGVAGAVAGSAGSGVTYTDVFYLEGASQGGSQGTLPANGSGSVAGAATALSADGLKAAASASGGTDGPLSASFVPSRGGLNAGFPLLLWQLADFGALDGAIAEAEAALEGVVTSEADGADVATADWWVTPDVLAALAQAISEAEAVAADVSSAQDAIDAATSALVEATEAFSALVQPGTAEEDPGTLPPPAPPTPPANESWKRLWGADRYDTMAAIVSEAFGAGDTDAVIVATGENFPDALAASGLAGIADAPVVLTEGDSLSAQARAAIEALAPSTVYIAGGPGSVSLAVEESLKSLVADPSKVVRSAGADRYLTALDIYAKGKATGAWGSVAIIASGDNYADALSVSPYSFAERAPIFLADPTSGLDVATATTLGGALEAGEISHIIIAGGPGSVPDVVKSQLGYPAGDYTTFTRLYGADRYGTSIAVANYAAANSTSLGFHKIAVATGENFPDALAGGAFAGRFGTVLLLVSDDASGRVGIASVVGANATAIGYGHVLGGEGTVSPALQSALEAASSVS
jgi:putative cell wall-binding protein/uncharacterized protein YjdB